MTCIEEGNLNVLDISARMRHRALQGYGMQVLLLSDTSKCEVIDWDSWLFGSFVLNRLVRGNFLNACETWLWQAISLFCFYSLAVTQSLILISFIVCSVQKVVFFCFFCPTVLVLDFFSLHKSVYIKYPMCYMSVLFQCDDVQVNATVVADEPHLQGLWKWISCIPCFFFIKHC